MAKLKAPLLSLGASQQLGKALVFFAWKGLNVVREYVVPSNPRTAAQTTQRGYLTAVVASIHQMQARATHPLDEVDKTAYALWASVVQSATTWFNQAVRNGLDQLRLGKTTRFYGDGYSTPGADKLDVGLWEMNAYITAGAFHYGTSKTSLINSQADVPAVDKHSCTLSGLTTGIKYYWQFRPTLPIGALGSNSGIYHGTPT